MDCARASLAARAGLRADEISLRGRPLLPHPLRLLLLRLRRRGKEPQTGGAVSGGPLPGDRGGGGPAGAGAALCAHGVYRRRYSHHPCRRSSMSALMGRIRAHIDLSRCTEYGGGRPWPPTPSPPELAAIRENGRTGVGESPVHGGRVLAAMGQATRRRTFAGL